MLKPYLESLFCWVVENRRGLTIAALYVACILAADLLAARWIVSLPFGLAVPAGVFAVAPVFTLRDEIHERWGRRGAYALIALASLCSWGLAVVMGSGLLARVTLASVVAFLVNEALDTEIYHQFMSARKEQTMSDWSTFVYEQQKEFLLDVARQAQEHPDLKSLFSDQFVNWVLIQVKAGKDPDAWKAMERAGQEARKLRLERDGLRAERQSLDLERAALSQAGGKDMGNRVASAWAFLLVLNLFAMTVYFAILYKVIGAL